MGACGAVCADCRAVAAHSIHQSTLVYTGLVWSSSPRSPSPGGVRILHFWRCRQCLRAATAKKKKKYPAKPTKLLFFFSSVLLFYIFLFIFYRRAAGSEQTSISVEYFSIFIASDVSSVAARPTFCVFRPSFRYAVRPYRPLYHRAEATVGPTLLRQFSILLASLNI